MQSRPNCTTTVIMMMGKVSMPNEVIPMAALRGVSVPVEASTKKVTIWSRIGTVPKQTPNAAMSRITLSMQRSSPRR